MIRLLHTADVHIGARFLGLGEKGKTQREQIKSTFKNLISLAIAEKIDIVLIAGDLFDSNQQPQVNIDLVAEQFDMLAASNITICMIPGTHDCFDSGSVYRKFNFQKRCSSLTLFTNEGWNYKEFPTLGLTVYGKPNFSNHSLNSPLAGLKPATMSPYHVAMAHGSLSIPGKSSEDDYTFTPDQIQESQMQYIALGHWHNRPYPCSDRGVIAWYSGAPELLSTDQRQPGSVLLVTISDSGEVKVEPRQTGVRICDEMEIDLSAIENLTVLKNKISEGANTNLIRRVVLKGLRSQDIRPSKAELEADLKERFFHLSVSDQSHPRIDTLSESQFEDKLIIARFVSLMKQKIETSKDEEREIAEEALQYGLALLQGKEVI